ncbi:MAG: hypothetical protein COA95_08260 [Methylophaga sp.]|nr:MAG: hypothetical protein COA95_08260 [Methylophaga sp.]
MSKWLASVQSLEEACTLLPALPDILDMKDPSKGALGALSLEAVSNIVSLIDKRCLTSATVGDLPMDASVIGEAMIAMASTGVDYVKIGLFPDDNVIDCIEKLEEVVKNLEKPVIAVLFADKNPNLELISYLKESGFSGVMIDTAIKNGKGLRDHWDFEQITAFVERVEQQGMICGLAGALKIEDITELKPLKADYLGFRSALCDQQQRTSMLQLSLAQQVQNQIKHAGDV